MNGGRKLLRFLLATTVPVLAAACHHEGATSFEQSLRCGMTVAEARRIAQETGYGSSDSSWLTRSVASQSKQSKELRFVDLRFHGGRLAGFTVRSYEPGTKRIVSREVDLCGAPGLK